MGAIYKVRSFTWTIPGSESESESGCCLVLGTPKELTAEEKQHILESSQDRSVYHLLYYRVVAC